ncbi:LCP family protein [Paenibacillus sp. GCM10023250]|uniref:LCP family glycopolymer transferase n=1 Tax=Paenibacillus sp. GCM10023250 TaxID=3252648 RepID=UPI00361CC98E
MKTPAKRLIIWVGIAMGALVLFVGGFFWYFYHSVKQTADRMYEQVDSVKPMYVSKDESVKILPTMKISKTIRPFTVLLLGVDQRDHDNGRSDSIIVMTVNPNKHSILMFNIPRDTRTEIIGHGTVDKINHAYAFGGVAMSMATVENFIDFPIDYYIKVNMQGFAKLIDLVGGVEVDNPFAFDYSGHHFEQGRLSLNGDEALLYSRMRYDDPRGDLGRNTRQRDILQAIMKNSLSISSVTHIHSMLGQLGDSVKTNMNFDEMKSFVLDYRPLIKSVDTVEVQGQGETISAIWYYKVAPGERERIHNLIKEHIK